MILVDFSGICLATILINKENDERMIRHMTLNSLRMYNQKFKENYGQMVLACDGPNNWRKEYFPQYKGVRRKSRQESTFDWNEAFRILNSLREEIRDNFPYKVIHMDQCEADDIIGTLVENSQEFGNFEPIMIVSADGDFKQLQKYNNVSQWSPLTKKLVEEGHPRQNLKLKILQGDSGDGVPNVLSDDDTLIEGRRQTPLSKKTMDRWFLHVMGQIIGGKNTFHNIKVYVGKADKSLLLIGMKHFVFSIAYVKRYVITFHTRLFIWISVKQMTLLVHL